MGADTAALVDQVLALPDRERGEFLAERLARLPGASNEVVGEDWDVVEQRLLAKYPMV